MHPNGAPGCGTGSPTGGAVRCTAPAQWTECSSCGNAPPTTSLANAFAALMACGGVSVGHRRPGVGVADAVTWSLMLTGGAHPLPARVTEGVLSRCWMHRSLTVCRGMAGAGFQAGVQASAGWPVAAIRWRRGRKRGEMPLNVDRNLCATPTERKLFMVRSRCRVGWADAGADLLAEDLVSGDAVLAERVELGVEFLPEHQAITAATGMPIYLCKPRSPWQRGINENTNRLLRQHLPKGADLRTFGQADLDAVAHELNHRPRKIHGYRTPAEVYADLLNSDDALTP